MSAWRGEALRLFPDLRETVLKAESQEEVWTTAKATFYHAVQEGEKDRVRAVFKFALLFLHSRAQAGNRPTLSREAAEFLYDNIDILHEHLAREDLMKGQMSLKVILGESKYREFDQRFYGRLKGFPGQRQIGREE